MTWNLHVDSSPARPLLDLPFSANLVRQQFSYCKVGEKQLADLPVPNSRWSQVVARERREASCYV